MTYLCNESSMFCFFNTKTEDIEGFYTLSKMSSKLELKHDDVVLSEDGGCFLVLNIKENGIYLIQSEVDPEKGEDCVLIVKMPEEKNTEKSSSFSTFSRDVGNA